MTSDATVAPPSRTAARRFNEQITALIDQQTKEYILGVALLEAESGGYARPKEGETIRTLLDESIHRAYRRDVDAYNAAVQRGRRELLARDAARASKIAAASRA